jgi:hypothetical protein
VNAVQRFGIISLLIILLSSLLFPQQYDARSIIIRSESDTVTEAAISNILQKSYSAAKKISNKTVSAKFSKLLPDSRTTKSSFKPKYYTILLQDSVQADLVFRQLQNEKNISVYRNYLYRIQSLPNDSAFSSQWNLVRTGVASLFARGIISSNLPLTKVGINQYNSN